MALGFEFRAAVDRIARAAGYGAGLGVVFGDVSRGVAIGAVFGLGLYIQEKSDQIERRVSTDVLNPDGGR